MFGAFAWHLFGVCLEFAWSFLDFVWKMFEICWGLAWSWLKVVLTLFEVRLEFVWSWLGVCGVFIEGYFASYCLKSILEKNLGQNFIRMYHCALFCGGGGSGGRKFD